MGCCTTKGNTKEKVKTDKKSSCDTAQTENLTTSKEHSAEDCNDNSCKIHHSEDSEQKSDDACGCK